jgi:myo-inositol 2-dehydrogenase / D-chiro-inositol 1-dehydrogenase
MKTACLHAGASLERRLFLRQLACCAGAAWAKLAVIPARCLGAEGGVSPGNRVTIGMIGTGRQAVHANLPGFLKEPDAQVVAVCDVDAWRMEKARQQVEEFYAAGQPSGRYQGCATFRDWRELLARGDIDAVMISTPDHWHVPMALAAARAGKDIACEKPLTRSIAEGRWLSDLVVSKKIVFRTDSEFRSLRSFHRVVELVRNGRLGQLKAVVTGTPKDPTLPAQAAMPVPEELDYETWLGPAPQAPYTMQRVHPRRDAKGRPGWLCIRDYADGMLANWGAHLNDMAMWAMDTERTGPVEIEGRGHYPPSGNLWNIIQEFEVHFRFAAGVSLTCKTDKPYVRFEGSEGWIQVTYPNEIEAHPPSLLQWKRGPADLALPYKTSEKRDFLDAVKTRGRTQLDAEVGHRNTSLAHLGLLAIDLGRKLKWDPARERFIGDDQANQRLQPKPWRKPWDKLAS